MLITEFKRKDGECEQSYLWRLGQAKDAGTLDAEWSDIADVLNREFKIEEEDYKTESAFRRAYQSARLFYTNVFSKQNTPTTSEELEEAYRELRRERIRLQDERTDYNRKLREQARVDQKLDRLAESLNEFGRVNFCARIDDKVSVKVNEGSDKEMIVMLSDPHFGARFYSFNGVYDPDVALERISKYADKVKKIQAQCGASKCYLVLLGDLIEGAARITQRIESSDNVIEQIKIAAQLVSNFITQMSGIFETVEVHNVTGNHGRIEAIKDNSMRNERFDDLIGWCCEQMLGHLENVEFTSALDSTVDTMVVCGQAVALTHGDFDDFTDAGVGKLCFMLGYIPALLIAAHKHYSEMSEVNGVKVVRSGSLCGSGGDFTMKKRLTGKASQAVLVMDENGIDAFYPVGLE